AQGRPRPIPSSPRFVFDYPSTDAYTSAAGKANKCSGSRVEIVSSTHFRSGPIVHADNDWPVYASARAGREWVMGGSLSAPSLWFRRTCWMSNGGDAAQTPAGASARAAEHPGDWAGE